MGSPVSPLARVTSNQSPVDITYSLPARDFSPVARNITYIFRMNLLHLLSLLCCIFLSTSSHLSGRVRRGDGYADTGGVYNSTEAQAYWARRFGGGFFGNLRALQQGIDSAAAGRRP